MVDSYEIRIKKSAEKDLNLLNEKYFHSIIERIKLLKTNPLPNNVKKLRGSGYYRIRSGDYRIIYEIDFNNRSIEVYSIVHRSVAYK